MQIFRCAGLCCGLSLLMTSFVTVRDGVAQQQTQQASSPSIFATATVVPDCAHCALEEQKFEAKLTLERMRHDKVNNGLDLGIEVLKSEQEVLLKMQSWGYASACENYTKAFPDDYASQIRKNALYVIVDVGVIGKAGRSARATLEAANQAVETAAKTLPASRFKAFTDSLNHEVSLDRTVRDIYAATCMRGRVALTKELNMVRSASLRDTLHRYAGASAGFVGVAFSVPEVSLAWIANKTKDQLRLGENVEDPSMLERIAAHTPLGGLYQYASHIILTPAGPLGAASTALEGAERCADQLKKMGEQLDGLHGAKARELQLHKETLAEITLQYESGECSAKPNL